MMTNKRKTALQLTLLLTVGAVIALWMTALACAPAAPAAPAEQEGAAGTAADPAVIPTATASATPTGKAPWDEVEGLPTPTLTLMQRQYTNMNGNLFPAILKHEEAMSATGSSGASANSSHPAPTPNVMRLIITIDAPENVEGVQRVLSSNGATNIWCGSITISDRVRGGCEADVPVSLLRHLAEQSGVLRIDPERTRTPASDLRRGP